MRAGHGGRRSRRVWSLLNGAALAVASAVAFSLPAGDVAAVSDYVSLDTSRRLVDTRPGAVTFDGQDAGIGRRAAGSTLEVQVAGRAGVPLDASTAVLTIAAVDPLADAFLTVHPTGTARPNASNVNYNTGQNIANTVLARLGTDGKVSIYTFAAAHLIVDVSGFFPAGSDAALQSPLRLVDTRPGAATSDGQDAGIGRRAAGSTLEVQVAGRAGVPLDASTAVLTIAAVDPLADAFLTVHPTGTARPNASNVNYNTGQNVANTVLARLGTDGKVSIYTFAATHLIVDVSGHLPDSVYTPLPAPRRLADTRPGTATIDGQQAGTGVVPGGNSLQVHVAGRAGVPADASTAVLTVAAVDPLDNAFLTVHPTGVARPNASNVNYNIGRNVANTVLARVGAGGDICIYSYATTHLIVDVAGYITGPPPPAAGPTCPPGPLPTWGPPMEAEGLSGMSLQTSAASNTTIVTLSTSGGDAEVATTTIRRSTDAAEWNHVVDIADVRLRPIVAAGPGFVAAGHRVTEPGFFAPRVPAVYTSADGLTWTPAAGIDSAPFANGEINDIAVTTTGLIAGGSASDPGGPNHPVLWTSPDGLTWDLQAPFGSFDDDVGVTVAAGAGGVVAIVNVFGESAFKARHTWWSADGVTWTPTPGIPGLDPGTLLSGPVAFGSGFVMAGYDRDPYVWTSPDGRTWNDRVPLPVRPAAASSHTRGIATDGAAIILAGGDVESGPGPANPGASIWMSLDATNWVQVPRAALDGDIVLDAVSAAEPLRFGDGWVVLGTTWSYSDGESSLRVVWHGVVS